jgi:hypothetical protein
MHTGKHPTKVNFSIIIKIKPMINDDDDGELDN